MKKIISLGMAAGLAVLSGCKHNNESFSYNESPIQNNIERLPLIVIERRAPFQPSSKIERIVDSLIAGDNDRGEISKAIFDWIVNNISYGQNRIKEERGYYSTEYKCYCWDGVRFASEVIEDREGVCSEMAELYVTMARYAGLTSAYVNVSKDYNGEEIYHACAAVELNGELILVDPAYGKYDIKHKEFLVLGIEEAISLRNSDDTTITCDYQNIYKQ